jgi:hypothetical protein
MTGYRYFDMNEYWSWKAQQEDEKQSNSTTQEAKAA